VGAQGAAGSPGAAGAAGNTIFVGTPFVDGGNTNETTGVVRVYFFRT
jgi:hypothetical protein